MTKIPRANPKPKPRVRFEDPHADGSTSDLGTNIADEKRLKKAEKRTKLEIGAVVHAVLVAAKRGYEHFH